MAEYTPQKVRLKTPETASEQLYLYPVTGLNAITVGTSAAGNAYTTYIAPDGKILAPYLDIMTTTPTDISASVDQYKVDNNRLSFIISGSTINESYLPFILDPLTANARINPDYLPGFVDDVVEVPIKKTSAYPSSGTLLISANVTTDGTTYWFYTKSGTTWNLGGGESGKLYVGEGETDGAIYRAVNTSSAAKISESPYSIDETPTNGVHLTKLANNLSAVASLATTGGPGTIQIDADVLARAVTRPVWFGLSNGILTISAGLAATNMAGAVFTVGTDADYNTLISGGYGAAYIVPTVAWTKQLISSSIVGVGSASYDDFGIVKIQTNGGINCVSGVLSVPAASANVQGLTYLLDTIDTATPGNNGKAITQGAVVQYITSSVVPDLQGKLIEGNGIDIDADNTIAVAIVGDGLDFSTDSRLTLTNATATELGGVLITGDQSFIENGSATYDNKPIAVNPVAVSGYVSSVLDDYTSHGQRQLTKGTGIEITSLTSQDQISVNYAEPIVSATSGAITVQKAAVGKLGVVQLNSANTGIGVDGDGIISAKIDTNVMAYDANNKITVSSASINSGGVVQIVSTGQQLATSATYSAYVPTASAVIGYLDTNYQKTLSKGVGINITSGTVSVNYTGAIVSTGSAITVQNAGVNTLGVVKTAASNTGISVDSNGLITAVIDPNIMAINASNQMTVNSASTSSGGIVQIVSTGVQAADGATYSAYVPTISAMTGYLDANYQKTISKGVGINITSGTVSVNYTGPIVSDGSAITVQKAGANVLGVVKTAATNTGIAVDSNGLISAVIDSTVMAFDANNKMTVSSATISSGGIVQIVSTGIQAADVATYSAHNPTVSAMVEYVATQIAGGTVTVTEGDGIIVSATTTGSSTDYEVSARTKSPIHISGSAIAINTASASIDGTLPATALGAVYVYGLGIRSEFTSGGSAIVTNTANTVPTESAVRTALNALPYITYEKLSDL